MGFNIEHMNANVLHSKLHHKGSPHSDVEAKLLPSHSRDVVYAHLWTEYHCRPHLLDLLVEPVSAGAGKLD